MENIKIEHIKLLHLIDNAIERDFIPHKDVIIDTYDNGESKIIVYKHNFGDSEFNLTFKIPTIIDHLFICEISINNMILLYKGTIDNDVITYINNDDFSITFTSNNIVLHFGSWGDMTIWGDVLLDKNKESLYKIKTLFHFLFIHLTDTFLHNKIN